MDGFLGGNERVNEGRFYAQIGLGVVKKELIKVVKFAQKLLN